MPANFIQIVSIPVTDQQVAKTFYTEALGFSVLRDDPFDNGSVPEGIRWIQLGIEGAQTSITLVTWFPQMPAGSAQGLLLNVSDVDAMRDSLLERGIDVSGIESEMWGRYFTLSDPDGNGWVIQEDPA